MNFEDFRKKLRIDVLGAVNIVFDVDTLHPDQPAEAVLCCVACDSRMLWSTASLCYECPECALEITPFEALDLVNKCHEMLKNFEKKHGKKVSFWRRIFK